MEQYLDWLPNWAIEPVIALAIIIVGYFISKVAGMVVSSAINKTGLGRKAKTTGGNIGKSLSNAVFWVLWLVFILSALSGFEALSGEGKPLAALNGMMEKVFDYLPQIGGALLIGIIGYIVSNVARMTATSTLEAVQIDRVVSKFNVKGDDFNSSNTIAKAIGALIFGVLILLFATEVFDKLGLGDFRDMLRQISKYIYSGVGAVAILAVSVYIGRFVSKLVEDILPGLGFDNAIHAISGLDGEDSSSKAAPSKIVSIVTFAGILLMGLVASFKALGIPELTDIFASVLEFGGKITVGAIIIGVGLFIANFVSRIATQAFGVTTGTIIKYFTMILVTFMGLNQMNIGQEIVDTAFKSFVWAAAFAAGVGGALAFGWGGHKWAGTKLEQWFPSKAKSKAKAKPRAKK